MSEVAAELLAEFDGLSGEAVEVRRQSFSLPEHFRATREAGRAAAQLSRHLLRIHYLIDDHPELQEDYRSGDASIRPLPPIQNAAAESHLPGVMG